MGTSPQSEDGWMDGGWMGRRGPDDTTFPPASLPACPPACSSTFPCPTTAMPACVYLTFLAMRPGQFNLSLSLFPLLPSLHTTTASHETSAAARPTLARTTTPNAPSDPHESRPDAATVSLLLLPPPSPLFCPLPFATNGSAMRYATLPYPVRNFLPRASPLNRGLFSTAHPPTRSLPFPSSFAPASPARLRIRAVARHFSLHCIPRRRWAHQRGRGPRTVTVTVTVRHGTYGRCGQPLAPRGTSTALAHWYANP